MFKIPLQTRVHKVLEIISKRGVLTDEFRTTLSRLDAGYRGEMHVYHYFKKTLSSNPISLYNLHLKVNGSTCQIDCLLIFQHEIILFEVKNFQGDFIMDNDKWYTLAKKNVRNPLHQLQRTELLLQQLLTAHTFPFKIRSFLIFTNSSFFLYQAPVDLPAIFPNQLNRSIQKMHNIPCLIGHQHAEFAELLKAHHQSSSVFESIPRIDYDSLTKGISCKNCDGYMLAYKYDYLRCSTCETIEDLTQGLMRSIHEFHTLFPHKKIKIQKIAAWINNCVSPYKIRKVLSQSAKLINKGRESYYLFPDIFWDERNIVEEETLRQNSER